MVGYTIKKAKKAKMIQRGAKRTHDFWGFGIIVAER